MKIYQNPTKSNSWENNLSEAQSHNTLAWKISTLLEIQWFPKEMPTFVWNKYPCQMLARNSWGYVSILSAALKLGILYLSASICSIKIHFIYLLFSFCPPESRISDSIDLLFQKDQTSHSSAVFCLPPAPNCHIKRSSALQLRTKSPKNCF